MSVALDQEQNQESLEIFLAELRAEISSCSRADTLELFDVFSQEARVCRAWLNSNLNSLPAGSSILEVGAGLMLMGCQLQREGFFVTALEPIGPGFTVFSELQKKILEFATSRGFAPTVLSIPVEELVTENVFSLAYSFNVMEHVANVPTAIAKVLNALKEGGEYRFTCPNYLFPYEPHFNIPTLFSKRLTAWVFWSKINRPKGDSDLSGLWASLNWITVPQIRHVLSEIGNITFWFDRTFLVHTLARIESDPIFAARRSPWLCRLLTTTVHLGLHRWARLIPATLQPIIDCHILLKKRS